jgi:hypothetical protein
VNYNTEKNREMAKARRDIHNTLMQIAHDYDLTDYEYLQVVTEAMHSDLSSFLTFLIREERNHE